MWQMLLLINKPTLARVKQGYAEASTDVPQQALVVGAAPAQGVGRTEPFV